MPMDHPVLAGHVEISYDKEKIVIAGDPEGLNSLADMLHWLAAIDQESIEGMPDGYREHIHLDSGTHISYGSEETEICRLDGKGNGSFPSHYKST